ncbi:MAG: 6-pyruvoyl-tetrahydropterin synthase-related protein [Patescibacteria group bacterium]|nr:6-pyruvoyl-tetrahydropterin synthase-related protein [Patescibacteria group bacterium]
MKKIEKIILIFFIFLIIFFLGKDLLPTNDYFFPFHDNTQATRIEQFTKELKKLNIPPRIASDMNFNLGFPIFNFYAPTAYWITSLINLIILDPITSLKISFLSTIILSFLFSFIFYRNFFNFYSSLIGAVIYSTCLYIASNIFVRGNLAELWFITLFPLTLNFIYKNSQKYSKKYFFTTSLLIFLLLTTHNIYSLLIIPFLLIYIFINKNVKINILSLIFGFFLSSYFWIPLFFEAKYIWGKEIAILTNYKDHFLCIRQLWDYPWGFGTSKETCQADTMSFQIGKFQIIFFFCGFILLIINFLKNIKNKNLDKKYLSYIFFSGSTLFFLFLTHHKSIFFWNLFSNYLSVIQFPWRFIGLSIIGLGFMTSYFFNNIKINKKCLILILSVLIISINEEYFFGQRITNTDFKEKYLSKKYIEKESAYGAQEHLPKTINYQKWLSLNKLDDNSINKEIKKLSIKPFSKNKQTQLQKYSNYITILSFIFLLFFLKIKKI